MRLPLGRVPRAFTRRGLNVRAWTWTTPESFGVTREAAVVNTEAPTPESRALLWRRPEAH